MAEIVLWSYVDVAFGGFMTVLKRMLFCVTTYSTKLLCFRIFDSPLQPV